MKWTWSLVCVTLVACTGSPDGEPTPPHFEAPVAVITTTDYVVGSMAAVSLDTLEITDELLPSSGDPVVFAQGSDVWQVNRSNASIRFFRLPDLTTPRLEISTGQGTNPRSVALCGDSLYVAMLNTTYLLKLDPETGAEQTRLDLSDWNDEDGIPEAQSLAVIDHHLFVSLGRLNRNTQPWSPGAGGGRILGIDCTTGGVDWEVTTGPDATVTTSHSYPGQLLVTDGVYYDEDENIALDGGLAVVEPFVTESLTYLAREQTWGGNFFGVADTPAGMGILLVVTDAEAQFHCLNLDTGEMNLLASTLSFVPQIITAPDGLIWASLKAPYTHPDEGGGVIRLDPQICAEVTPGNRLTFSLDPFGIAFVERG